MEDRGKGCKKYKATAKFHNKFSSSQLINLLNFMRANKFARINLLQAKVSISFSDGCILNGLELLKGIRENLKFWRETELVSSPIRATGRFVQLIEIHTDASSKSYGVESANLRISGQFMNDSLARPIFQKEALAITVALGIWASSQPIEDVYGQCKLVIACDNKTVVQSYRRGRSRDNFLNKQIINWNTTALKFNGQVCDKLWKKVNLLKVSILNPLYADLILISVSSAQQKADTISRYDFTKTGMTLSTLGIERLSELVKILPKIDGFSTPDNIIDIPGIKYISKFQPTHRDNNKLIGVDFFKIDWSVIDKDQIIWVFPPEFKCIEAIRTIINFELAAYVLVPCDNGKIEWWFAEWMISGGYIEKFCENFEFVFTIGGKREVAGREYMLLVSKMAKLLNKE